ncbi:hypothetical protein [Lachnotalea glycerini]|nr:hypothetical protein [Lachnotalea glycerini]
MLKNVWLYDVLDIINEQDQNYRESMLFNGLYYLRPYSKQGKITVKVSYVVNNVKLSDQENEHEEYFISKRAREILKIKLKKPEKASTSWRTIPAKTVNAIKSLPIDIEEMRLISACPFKYFYSKALDENPYTYGNNEFQLKRFYQEYIRNVIRFEASNVDNVPNFKNKLLRMSKLLMDDIMLEKEMEEIINYEVNNKKQTAKYKFEPSLPFFWKNDVDSHLNLQGTPWRDRADENYCRNVINEYTDGFKHDDFTEYKVSEYLCDNCPQRGLCLYPYRVESKHLLRKP